MEQPGQILEYGTRVRTHAQLDSTAGMLVTENHIHGRLTEAVGIVESYVPGHGGDAYFVRHAEGPAKADPSPVAVYCFTEFELET